MNWLKKQSNYCGAQKEKAGTIIKPEKGSDVLRRYNFM